MLLGEPNSSARLNRKTPPLPNTRHADSVPGNHIHQELAYFDFKSKLISLTPDLTSSVNSLFEL